MAVLSDVIKHLKDVVLYLEEASIEVVRETKQSISIKDPDGGRNIRLKGAVYERDFKFSREIAAEIKERGGEYQSRIGERLSNAQECYQYGIEKRRAYLEQRYRGIDREATVTFEGVDKESIGAI